MDGPGTRSININTSTTNGTTKQHKQSYLFLLRVWDDAEDQGGNMTDLQQWHGKLQYVLGHDAQYFQDWLTLVDALLARLSNEQDAQRRQPLSRHTTIEKERQNEDYGR